MQTTKSVPARKREPRSLLSRPKVMFLRHARTGRMILGRHTNNTAARQAERMTNHVRTGKSPSIHRIWHVSYVPGEKIVRAFVRLSWAGKSEHRRRRSIWNEEGTQIDPCTQREGCLFLLRSDVGLSSCRTENGRRGDTWKREDILIVSSLHWTVYEYWSN